MNRTQISIAACCTAAWLALAGCASTPAPNAPLAVAKAAYTHAVGAGSLVLAPAEMALARDKLQRADLAMAREDHDIALTLAQQEQADAQLAEARAEAVKAQRSVTALQEAGSALRDEMARKPK